MLKTIEFKGNTYGNHEAEGNAAQFIIPLAKKYCDPDGLKSGLDIGCNREDWAFPKAFRVDPVLNEYHAMNLPGENNFWDYIFSSHCLEHVKENWYNVLDYWLSKLCDGGILFLYLPHNSQVYWKPENNRKHIHSFHGAEIEDYLTSLGHKVLLGGCDANHSFTVICEKDPIATLKSTTFYSVPIGKIISRDFLDAVIKMGIKDGFDITFKEHESQSHCRFEILTKHKLNENSNN